MTTLKRYDLNLAIAASIDLATRLTFTKSTVGISFDVAHFGSVCHWLAFPIAESYWVPNQRYSPIDVLQELLLVR